MDTDETFRLKTSSWKTLRFLNSDLSYDTGNRRSLLTASRNTAGVPSSSSLNESVPTEILGQSRAEFAGTQQCRDSWNPAQAQGVHNSDGKGDQAAGFPVILSKEKYYCNPSTSDLARRTNANGSCLVENFEVGHVEWGKVVFLGVMDVSGLNLDDMSKFNIYNLQTQNKPRRNKQLN